MTQPIKEMTVELDWIKGVCPWCKNPIYIDDKNRRTLHKNPICAEYERFVSAATCEGKVNLKENCQ